MPSLNFNQMKIKHFILLVPLFWACNENDIVAPRTETNVTEEYGHIISMANEAMDAVIPGARATNTAVESVYPWLSSDIYADLSPVSRSNPAILPDTMLYVVNYTDNAGFAIVSDNERYDGVVALIEEENFVPGEEISNPGMQFFLELYREAYLQDNLSRTIDATDIASYIENTPVAYAANIDEEGWTTSTIYPNKLRTKWGQGHPYNMYCFTLDGKQAKAGCVPVAIGQVLSYYSYPQTINGYTLDWNHLHFEYPSNINQAEQSARLLRELGTLTGATYGESETGAYHKMIRPHLTEWGYEYMVSDPDKVSDTFSEIMMIHNLYEYGPAIVSGSSYDDNGVRISGHCWVIDGAIAQTGYSTYRFLYHCNWGWNGSKNGYFLATAFDPYEGKYAPRYQYNYGLYFTGFLKKPE